MRVSWQRMMRGIAILLTLCCVMTAFVFASDTGTGSEETTCLSVIYGVVAALSLLLLIGYGVFFHRKERWFLILFISVFVTNLGYFLLAISETLSEAMFANRVSYLGSVCLPLCMLMIIAGLCDLRIRKSIMGVLISVSTLVFLLAASGGYLTLYYKEVSLVVVGGTATLKKVYGPFHQVYFIYLFAYLAVMVAVILYAAKKKKGQLRKYAPIMCTIVLMNIAIWFIEQQIHWEFELLSVSYIVSELLLLCVYSILRDSIQEIQTPPAIEDVSRRYPSLTSRELDVLKLMLENKKRKEIAEELFVTENTIKKHTAHIYEKLDVSDRSELLMKLSKPIM